MTGNERIYVAGHRGMVGSAIVRFLQRQGFPEPIVAARAELDLRDQNATLDFLLANRPDVVVIAAAKVGGIHANSTYPAEFLQENLSLELNLIWGAFRAGVRRLLFLGSSCIYPKESPQPIPESELLTGSLEPTNEPYAIAKIAGLKLCEAYRRQFGVIYHSGMPCNLYGPGDNYHAENSHVLPGLIRRFHEAKMTDRTEVEIWGTGKPLREFLHADDCAAGLLHLLQLEDPPNAVNIGSGKEISIGDLARLVAEAVGFQGLIRNDLSKPDGTPRKVMDNRLLLSLGWKPRIPLKEGIAAAYADFLEETRNGSFRS